MQNKKRFLIHGLILVIAVSVVSVFYQKSSAAPNWRVLGNAGFSDGNMYEASIAIYECDDSSQQQMNQQHSNLQANAISAIEGIQYASQPLQGELWPNQQTQNQPTPKEGSNGGSYMPPNDPHDKQDNGCREIYVGFQDVYNSEKMTVMKYNPTKDKWENVGSPGFSPGKVFHTDLAINSKGVPYVVFLDMSNTADYRLAIMKYNKSTDKWEKVGDTSKIWGSDTSLKFDSNDTPYISFSSDFINVFKFDGKNWVNTGNINSGTNDRVNETALYFDTNNTPYVAYSLKKDLINPTLYSDPSINIKKWNESKKEWDKVGDPFKVEADFLSFKLDLNNVPYVSFLDSGYYLKVLKFDGTKLEPVGDSKGLRNVIDPPSLIIGKDNIPYIFFQDLLNNSKGTVQGYNEKTNSWDDVEKAGFSPGGVHIYDNKAMVTDSDGNLYVAFKDYGNSDKISVMTNAKSANAHSWQNIGVAGFTSGVANFISFFIDSTNNKYVAFQDYANGAKASVMKYDDNTKSWGYVAGGNGFSNGVAAFISSAIDLNNNIYVAYQDGSIGGKATVKKFDGTAWSNVGPVGFSTGSISNTNIKIDSNGVPYVAFLQGSKVFAMKFDGKNWVDVSSASLPPSYNIALSIASNNIPHIAMKDNSKRGKLTVMELDLAKNIWKLVGLTAGFTNGAVDNIALTFSSNNIPEVAFSDSMNGNKVTSMYFDGKTWVPFGKPGFSAGRAGFLSIDIDKRDKWNNVSYVSFVDYDNGKKISVMKWDPIKGWIDVGTAVGNGIYSSLKIDKNGVPFNAFQDMGKGNKATLMKFD